MAEHTYIHSQHRAGAGPDHVGVEHEPREVVRVSSHGHVKRCAAQSEFAGWKHRLGGHWRYSPSIGMPSGVTVFQLR